jgi:hypothetical protein
LACRIGMGLDPDNRRADGLHDVDDLSVKVQADRHARAISGAAGIYRLHVPALSGSCDLIRAARCRLRPDGLTFWTVPDGCRQLLQCRSNFRDWAGDFTVIGDSSSRWSRSARPSSDSAVRRRHRQLLLRRKPLGLHALFARTHILGCRGRGEMVAKARAATRKEPSAVTAPARRRRAGTRRAARKPSVIRRIARLLWVSPRHVALALATGLVCGGLASRVGGIILPPYAAILGTLVVYPAFVAVWRLVPRPRRRR